MPDDARAALTILKSRFESRAAEYPDFHHILVEIPHEAPEPASPPPDDADLGERIAFLAFHQGQVIESCMKDREPDEKALIDRARREGLPARKAASIVRGGIQDGIEAVRAYRRSPFAVAYDEVCRAISWLSSTSTKQGRRRVVRRFAERGQPAQIFLDVEGRKGAFDALVELAEPAVEQLAGLRLLEPDEDRPDPSQPLWSDAMKLFYVRQWMLFVHRFAAAHPDVRLLSPELPMLDGFRLEHGGKARRLLLGVFPSSAWAVGRILVDDAQGDASVPSGGPLPRRVLTDTARQILRMLHRLKAFDRESRTTQGAVGADRVERLGNPDGRPFREAIRQLKEEPALIETSPGARGGMWLTPKGRVFDPS
jgi:hypothetical protein